MAPQIKAWEDLDFFDELVDEESDAPYTVFAVIDQDDTAYFGRVDHPKRDITFQQITSALSPISDDDLFPEWTPSIGHFRLFREHNVLSLIPQDLLEEAEITEKISKHLHPGIVRFHGCRVRRGHITGLVLDRHLHTLRDYLKTQVGPVDKESFMRALTSAIDHLHHL